ncbi:MAG: DUF3352 domain-containing protein [Bacteroidota bacterium]
MSRSLLIGIIATVALFSGIAVFFYMNNIKEKSRLASEAIPNDAFFIFQTKDIRSSWKSFSESSIWTDLQANPAISSLNRDIAGFNSLIDENEELKEMLSENTTAVSMHNTGGTLGLLFAVETGGQLDVNALSLYLSKHINGKVNKRSFEKIPVFDITDGLNNAVVTVAFYEQVLLCAHNANLIEDGLRKLKYRLPNLTKGFDQVQLLAESNADANLYVNYQRLPKLLSLFTKPEHAGLFNYFKTFANWSMLDVKIEKEKLSLKGVTFTDDSVFQFLDLFKNQTPKVLKLQEVMPFNTSFAFQMGFTDYMKFNSELNEYLQVHKKAEGYTKFTDSIESRYSIDINERVLPFIDGEAALVMVEPAGSDYAGSLAAFVRFKDPASMGIALKSFVQAMDKKGEADSVSYFHEGLEIERIKLDNFLKLYYGELMENIHSPYYSLIGDVYVFANDVNTLKYIISQHKQGITLANDEKYKEYASSLSQNNNVSIFISPSRNFLLPSQFVTDSFFSTLNTYQFDFKKFEFFNIQFANTNNKAFYTLVQYKYNTVNTPSGSQQLWAYKLDTTFDLAPQIVYSTKQKQNIIFVQDVKNTLYCLSNSGALLWKSKLSSRLTGDIYSVDHKNDGQLYYLLSTEKQVNLIDADGVSMPGYPVAYPGKTSFPLTINRSSGDTALTFFAALDNNRIMGYRINGRPIAGWNPRIIDARPAQQVTLFNFGLKQMLYTSDSKGRLLVFNYKGERVKLKNNFTAQSYYYEETDDTTALVFGAIDSSGTVRRITIDSTNTITDSTVLTTMIPHTQLVIKKDEVTGKNWFLAKTTTNWALYNAGFKKLAEENFADSTANTIYFTYDSSKRLMLAKVNKPHMQYAMFDMNGKPVQNSTMQGYSAFVTGDVLQDKKNYLLGGDASNNIFLFRLR